MATKWLRAFKAEEAKIAALNDQLTAANAARDAAIAANQPLLDQIKSLTDANAAANQQNKILQGQLDTLAKDAPDADDDAELADIQKQDGLDADSNPLPPDTSGATTLPASGAGTTTDSSASGTVVVPGTGTVVPPVGQ